MELTFQIRDHHLPRAVTRPEKHLANPFIPRPSPPSLFLQKLLRAPPTLLQDPPTSERVRSSIDQRPDAPVRPLPDRLALREPFAGVECVADEWKLTVAAVWNAGKWFGRENMEQEGDQEDG